MMLPATLPAPFQLPSYYSQLSLFPTLPPFRGEWEQGGPPPELEQLEAQQADIRWNEARSHSPLLTALPGAARGRPGDTQSPSIAWNY